MSVTVCPRKIDKKPKQNDPDDTISTINVFFKKDLTVCWEWTESALEDEHHIIKHTLSLSASGPFDKDLRPLGWMVG